MTNLNTYLRSLRKREGWTQDELAQRAGVHVNTVYAIEQNPERAVMQTLERIAAAYGMELWKLLQRAEKSQQTMASDDCEDIANADR